MSISKIYSKYTSNPSIPFTETTQKQMLIELGYYPFDAPVVRSLNELEKLIESKEKFNINELKSSIKNVFGTQEVSKEVLLSKLVTSGVLEKQEEEEFIKIYGDKIDLDTLIDQITKCSD